MRAVHRSVLSGDGNAERCGIGRLPTDCRSRRSDRLAGQIVGKHHSPFPVHVGLDDQIDPDPRRFRPASLALELYAIADARLGADVIEAQGSEVAGSNSYSDMLNGRGDPAGSCGRSGRNPVPLRRFSLRRTGRAPVVFGYYAGIPAIVRI